MTEEIWRTSAFIPTYEVSNLGKVRLIRTGRLKEFSYNQYGAPYVGVYDIHRQKNVNKPVATLVAEMFVERENREFNTVVHLNADRTDVRADNLVWRTRSFAINYHKQIGFREGREFVDHTFECIETGEIHTSTYRVAMTDGVLPSAIFSSVLNNDQWYEEDKPWTKWQVHPTGKSYRSVGRYSFKDRTGL